MKKITNKQLIESAESIKLELADDVKKNIKKYLRDFNKRLEELHEYDTENVEPLTHINEMPLVDFLREDIVDENIKSLEKQKILSNASESDSDYVVVDKVVK